MGYAGRYLRQDVPSSVVKVVSPEVCCQPGYFLSRPENLGKLTGGSSGLQEGGDAKGAQMFPLRKARGWGRVEALQNPCQSLCFSAREPSIRLAFLRACTQWWNLLTEYF